MKLKKELKYIVRLYFLQTINKIIPLILSNILSIQFIPFKRLTEFMLHWNLYICKLFLGSIIAEAIGLSKRHITVSGKYAKAVFLDYAIVTFFTMFCKATFNPSLVDFLELDFLFLIPI